MLKITVYSNNPPGKGWTRLLTLAGAVKDGYAPDVEVEVIYKGDMPDMPEPPNIAVGDRLLGREITAEKMEEIVSELLPIWRFSIARSRIELNFQFKQTDSR